MPDMTLRQYGDELFGGEDPLLREIREEAADLGLPTIQVPLEVGRLLAVLIAQAGARRALEIGTLFGYSAILMARALPPGGTILTLEVDPRHAELARRNFRRADVLDKVELYEGPALETLASLQGQTFDLVFIDANKDGYPEYLQQALNLTRAGSLIVADNVWRQGGAADPRGDEGNRAIARFNREVAQNPRLVSTIVPTRDCSDATSISVVREV